MTMDWSIEIDQKAIKALAGGEEMREYMTVVGFAIESVAKAHAPVDTGNLRRSIYSVVEPSGSGWVAIVGTNVEYAIYQELGTRYHPAQPFLRPALEAVVGG